LRRKSCGTRNAGNYLVYQSVISANQVQYVGITSDYSHQSFSSPCRKQWLGVSFPITQDPGTHIFCPTPSHYSAEQTLIDTYGLREKTAAHCSNMRNSISPITDPEFISTAIAAGPGAVTGSCYPLLLTTTYILCTAQFKTAISLRSHQKGAGRMFSSVTNHEPASSYGAIIRVLPGIFGDRPKEFQTLADQKELYYTLFSCKGSGKSAKSSSVVGHAEVPLHSIKFPIFRNALIDPQNRAVL